jgi:hypothetical protein
MFGLWSRLIFGILESSQGVKVLVKISYAMEGSTKKFGRQELVLEIRDAQVHIGFRLGVKANTLCRLSMGTQFGW